MVSFMKCNFLTEQRWYSWRRKKRKEIMKQSIVRTEHSDGIVSISKFN